MMLTEPCEYTKKKKNKSHSLKGEFYRMWTVSQLEKITPAKEPESWGDMCPMMEGEMNSELGELHRIQNVPMAADKSRGALSLPMDLGPRNLKAAVLAPLHPALPS